MLWDCITVLDDDTRAHIRSLGGIRAIAVSHPHFYTRMADWAEEFDAIVYVHAADKQFIVTPSERISYWTGTGADAVSITRAIGKATPVCLLLPAGADRQGPA